jgi:hypothetical protein
MITLQFTFEEQLTEVTTYDYNGTEQVREYKVWNVYMNGESFKDYIPPRLSGNMRVQWVFQQELQKRLLGLFGI